MATSGNKTVTFVLVLALVLSSISAHKYHTLHHMRDSLTSARYDRNRALHSLPSCLIVKESIIPDAGLGVFAVRDIPSGVVFGPYGGVRIYDRDESPDSAYVWKIHDRDGEVMYYIDGEDKARSNWIRYVNSACTEEQQNLDVFQYKSNIYYYSYKLIPKDTELLVWYGDEYGKDLGIVRDWGSDEEEDDVDDEDYVDEEDEYDDEDEAEAEDEEDEENDYDEDEDDEYEEDGEEDEEDDGEEDSDEEVSEPPPTCNNEKYAIVDVESFIRYITSHSHIKEEESSFLDMSSHVNQVKAGLVVIILLTVVMTLLRKLR